MSIFLVWSIIILVALGLLICFAILRFQSLQIEKRADILKEALWARRNRIPLLLEVIERASQYPKRNEIIQLRDKVSSEAYSLEEQIEFEKQLSKHLTEIFRGGLKSDSLYLSLQKELNELLESSRIAVNDYNFELQKWQRYVRLPWFKICEFGFKIRKNKPLGLV